MTGVGNVVNLSAIKILASLTSSFQLLPIESQSSKYLIPLVGPSSKGRWHSGASILHFAAWLLGSIIGLKNTIGIKHDVDKYFNICFHMMFTLE